MGREADNRKKYPDRENNESIISDETTGSMSDREAMTLIPWKDIWASLTVARHRGNGEMVEVFYDTLFKEAVFDDNGAWAWDINKRN